MNKGKELSLIKSNFLSFGIIKVFDYIFPLLLLPLMVRVLGIENYGAYVIAGSIAAISRIFISFGFDLTGSKELALAREDHKKVVECFNSIQYVKFSIFLMLTLLLLLGFFLTTIFDFEVEYWLFIFLFVAVFGDEVLYSNWFYYGMQKAKELALFKISQRFLLLLVVFSISLFDVVEEFKTIVFFEMILALIFGLLSFLMLVKKNKLKISFPETTMVVGFIKNGYHVFLSNISVYMYSSLNILIIGSMLGVKFSGIYAICEKIYMAVRSALEPFTQAVYPYLNRLYSSDMNNFFKTANKIILVYFLILISIAFFIYLFKEKILFLVTNKNDLIAENVLVLFLIALPLALGGMLSKLLVIQNKSNYLFRITFMAMCLNIIIIYPFVKYIGIYGAVFSFILVQSFQLLLQFKFYFKAGKYNV
ncbi:oligosaccharide flippase family protein [Acinetobacter lwoffii]|uniref:oligosaccharide flippase family protein n=1 Tax=Acinetobacter lwoffii TaxID=28090 RepID=UPI003F901D22